MLFDEALPRMASFSEEEAGAAGAAGAAVAAIPDGAAEILKEKEKEVGEAGMESENEEYERAFCANGTEVAYAARK